MGIRIVSCFNQLEINICFVSSILKRRKNCFCRDFRLSVFDGITRFGMSQTEFDCFWKMFVLLSVRMTKFCGKCNSETNAQNFMKLYTLLMHHDVNQCLSTFGEKRLISSAVIADFFFLFQNFRDA